MKNVIINDNVDIKDGIKEKPPIEGVIKIYDKDGNLIRQVHNMVVSTGRQAVFKLFANQFLSGTQTISTNGIKLCLSYLNTPVRTTPSITLSDIETSGTGAVAPFETSVQVLPDDFDPADLKITFSATIASNNTFNQLNQVYLKLVDTSGTNTSILFSRATIDPIFLNVGDEYKIDYTIYF